jgi:hypothetical protein
LGKHQEHAPAAERNRDPDNIDVGVGGGNTIYFLSSDIDT